MFNFLKEKFKQVVSKFSKEVEDEIQEAPKPEETEEKPAGQERKEPEKKYIKKEKGTKKELRKPEEKPKEEERPKEEKKKEIKDKEKPEETKEVKEEIKTAEEVKQEKPEEKKGFFKKITEAISKKALSEKQFDDLFFELEVVLMENNVAVEVIEKIKHDLKRELVEKLKKPGQKVEIEII